jgi:TRAP-type C4-dicarboxylate transport system substrate-binding protein
MICMAALALAACDRDGTSPAEARTTLDVAAATTTGTPAERHWQWFVTNVRSWAPEYRVALVNRTEENGPASLAGGRAGIVHAQPAELVALLPELALLSQPLLFLSDAEADHVLDRHVLPEVRRRLDAHGLTLLGWTEGEPRVVYLGREPLGLDVAQAPLAEHAALDGASVRLAGAPVLLDAGHVPGLIVAANAWFDPLSPHDEDVFRMAYATKDARADTRRVAGETVARLADDPVLAVRLPTDEERQRWRGQLAASHAGAATALGAAGESLLAAIERGRTEFAASSPAR